ncbi:universal stress protein, partial [Candidatus Sumerlaeota bacterium]|nr:universal stress protein [Candidatus Sumerlaeota bacterium]
MTSVKNILFPTDFSEYSDHARPYVVELAKKFGARVTLFHAIVSPPDPAYYEMVSGCEQISGLLREQARKRIEELAKAFEKEGIEVDREIRTGPAFVEIVAAARKRGID